MYELRVCGPEGWQTWYYGRSRTKARLAEAEARRQGRLYRLVFLLSE